MEPPQVFGLRRTTRRPYHAPISTHPGTEIVRSGSLPLTLIIVVEHLPKWIRVSPKRIRVRASTQNSECIARSGSYAPNGSYAPSGSYAASDSHPQRGLQTKTTCLNVPLIRVDLFVAEFRTV